MSHLLRRAVRAVSESLDASKGSRFRQNFLSVAKANVLAQALATLSAPLLTRFYAPSDFGGLTLFSSLLSFLLAFSIWRMDWSMPNTRTRAHAASLLLMGFIPLLLISAVLWVMRQSIADRLAFWNGFELVEPFLWLLPIALVGSGVYQLMQAWFIREAMLKPVSKSKVYQSLSLLVLMLLGGIFRLGTLGLIGSTAMSAWVGIGMMVRGAKDLPASLRRVSAKRLYVTWVRFRRETTFSTLVAIVNTLNFSITPLLISQYYNTTELGWYALMQKLAIAPIMLVAAALAQSFWAESARLVKEDLPALRKLYLKTSQRLLYVALAVSAITLAGPLYVGFMFGEENWGGAGAVLAALTPLFLGQIVVSPLSHLLVHSKQHWQFIWDICRLVSLVVVITYLGSTGIPFIQTVFCVSMVYLVMYGVLFGLNVKAFTSERRATR